MTELEQITKIASVIREQLLIGDAPVGMCLRVNEPIARHIKAELGIDCKLVNIDLSGKSWSNYNHHYFVELPDGTVVDGVFDQMGNRDQIYIGPKTVWHYGKVLSSEAPAEGINADRQILKPVAA